MLKPLLGIAVFSTVMIASPAISDPPASKQASARPAPKVAADNSLTIPIVILMSGLVLVTVANRRRSLQKVHC